MYGDCQVLPSVGGDNHNNNHMVSSSDSIFSSSLQNPSFNFLPYQPFSSLLKEENGLILGKDPEMEMSGSGSEQLVEEETTEQSAAGGGKKKRYHRHTPRQIQAMESLFKQCPHPDDKQRMRLSQDLGLKPRQVKFWFQNRRTQMKAQQDRSENVLLRNENETLKNENYRLQEEMRNLMCPNCGGQAILGGIPFEELRLENARLREELERMCCMVRYPGRQMQLVSGHAHPQMMQPSLDLDMNMYPAASSGEMLPLPMFPTGNSLPFTDQSHHQSQQSHGLFLMDGEKTLAMELAVASVEELVKLCQSTKPLWTRNNETGKETLNLEEHAKMFPWPLNLKQQPSNEFRREASRHNAVVIMNSITLVDAFLDANKWMELFPSIVARAKTIQVLSSGVNGASGSLHLMYAEFQALSPLIATREAHFLRFCQQNIEEGTWAIVDFPLDGLRDDIQSSFPLFRRRPSGCVIQDMPNGYSRVTWIEHAEIIEEKPVHHTFSHSLYNGTAFGAQRWLAVLQRQCERVASLMARNLPDSGVIRSAEARKNLMMLAQRMIKTFCVNISTSNRQNWTALPDSPDDTVRITTRTMDELGQPNGVILCAVSTTWLPYPHYQVFDFLRDERRRCQLEVLSNGNALQEVAHIANGSHPGNCISLLRINVASNSAHHVELMLQESCTDQSGSLVVYSTVDVESIKLTMSGEDPSCIPILPMGFVITPVHDSTVDASNTNPTAVPPPAEDSNGRTAGCLLTIGLQVLASNNVASAKINLSSITAINNHLGNTVEQITAALGETGGTNLPLPLPLPSAE